MDVLNQRPPSEPSPKGGLREEQCGSGTSGNVLQGAVVDGGAASVTNPPLGHPGDSTVPFTLAFPCASRSSYYRITWDTHCAGAADFSGTLHPNIAHRRGRVPAYHIRMPCGSSIFSANYCLTCGCNGPDRLQRNSRSRGTPVPPCHVQNSGLLGDAARLPDLCDGAEDSVSKHVAHALALPASTPEQGHVR